MFETLVSPHDVHHERRHQIWYQSWMPVAKGEGRGEVGGGELLFLWSFSRRQIQGQFESQNVEHRDNKVLWVPITMLTLQNALEPTFTVTALGSHLQCMKRKFGEMSC